MKLSGALFLALLFAAPSRADVLFIDLNVSSNEVEAARAAARQRGEELVVLPAISEEVRRRAAELKAPSLKLAEEVNALKARQKVLNTERQLAVTPTRLRAIYDEIEKVSAELSDAQRRRNEALQPYNAFLAQKITRFSTAQLDAALAERQRAGGSFSAIVLSGHHEGSSQEFFGDVGVLPDKALSRAFKKFPGMAEKVAGLYLWGCYSANPSKVRKWKSQFPNLNAVIGFDDRSPSDDKAVDSEYLRKVLLKEREVSRKADAAKVLALYRSIKDIKYTSASFCIGDQYVDKRGVRDLASADCMEVDLAQFREIAPEFERYLAAREPGYEDVSEDTGHGTLRRVYSLASKLQDCEAAKALARRSDQMLRLVFFKQLARNFHIAYGAEIKDFNARMRKRGAPARALIPDPGAKRADLLRWLGDADAFLNAMKAAESRESEGPIGWVKQWASRKSGIGSASDLQQLRAFHQAAERVLKDLSCTSGIWVEPFISRETLLEQFDQGCLQYRQ